MNLRKLLSPLAILAIALSFIATGTSAVAQCAATGENSTGLASFCTLSAPSIMSQRDMDAAQSRMPMLTDISQVPGYDDNGGFTSNAYGTYPWPFTTKNAAARSPSPVGVPVNLFPYRPTGKLFMTFGGATYVCTASVIRKGLVVTAAHCVHNFGAGDSGYASAVTFQPARHASSITYGTWSALEIWIPTVYEDGTDVCTVTGIVCENDIAILVMDTDPAPASSKEIAQVVNLYRYYSNDEGYTPFLGETAAQITQLGYPKKNYSGTRMIRTDSLGYQDTPSNVIIGSEQTGGSSGGPWIMNFGVDSDFSGTVANFETDNRVVAVTSWGFASDALKVLGASRFANNTTFTGRTNIRELEVAACSANPTKC